MITMGLRERCHHVVQYVDSTGRRRSFSCVALNQADAEDMAFHFCGDAIEAII